MYQSPPLLCYKHKQAVDERGSEVYSLQDTLQSPVTKMAVAPDGRCVRAWVD